jgi:hypothetical protein
VRRPYPTATDRRFAVLPRRAADVHLAAASTTGAASGPRASAHSGPTEPDDAARGAATTSAAPGASTGTASATPDADLVALGSFVGRTVRVGGLVTDLRPDGFGLDDGTSRGSVVLRAAALDLLPLVEVGDAINVTGSVEAGSGGPVVAVEDPAGLVLGGVPAHPQDATTLASPSTVASDPAGQARGSSVGARRRAGLASFPGDGVFGALGIGAIVGLTAASLLVTVARRRGLARRFVASLAAHRIPRPGRPTGP